MSTLKFRSVVTDRKSRNYGEVIEYTPEEKIPEAVQMALTAYAPYKDKYLAAATNIKVANYVAAPLGDKLNGKWANNVYDAHGVLTINKRHLHKDMMMMRPETVGFTIKFGDCLSVNGLPELKIINFELDSTL